MPTRPDGSPERVWPVARNPVRYDSIGRVCWVRLLPSYHEVAVPPEHLGLIAGFTWRQFGTLLCIDPTDEQRLAGAVIPDAVFERGHPDAAYAVACVEVLVMAAGPDGTLAPVPDAPRTVCLLSMAELLAAAEAGAVTAADVRRLAHRDVLRGGMPIFRVQEGAAAEPPLEEFPTEHPWQPPAE